MQTFSPTRATFFHKILRFAYSAYQTRAFLNFNPKELRFAILSASTWVMHLDDLSIYSRCTLDNGSIQTYVFAVLIVG